MMTTDAQQSRPVLPHLLVLSTALLTDRMLWYSDFFPALCKKHRATVWAMAARDPRLVKSWRPSSVNVEEFPQVRHFRMFPHTYLRRLNEFVSDHRFRPPSRLSYRRLREDSRLSPPMRAIKAAARVLALTGADEALERSVWRVLQRYPRSPEATTRLESDRPAALLATGPMRFEEPGVVAVAKKLRIPTLALISSWDNISIKKRMLFEYDGYMVWSEQMKRELLHYYPHARHVPVYVVGAPQFDAFFQSEFRQSRQEFCDTLGFRPEAPIILYTLGSPNLFREDFGAVDLARRIMAGELGDVQMLVRPHPVFDYATAPELLKGLQPRIVVQRTGTSTPHLAIPSQDRREILEWVNTFRHADVVINLASTATVDAAILDRPVINMDYDPEPGQPNQDMVKDANHVWTHFKAISESGGVWMVKSADEMVVAIRTYLAQPELHRKERQWIAQHVCGTVDGQSGRRFAEAVTHFVDHHVKVKSSVPKMSPASPLESAANLIETASS